MCTECIQKERTTMINTAVENYRVRRQQRLDSKSEDAVVRYRARRAARRADAEDVEFRTAKNSKVFAIDPTDGTILGGLGPGVKEGTPITKEPGNKEAKLNDLKNQAFLLSMKDTWSSADYDRNRELNKQIRELEPPKPDANLAISNAKEKMMNDAYINRDHRAYYRIKEMNLNEFSKYLLEIDPKAMKSLDPDRYERYVERGR
jgi:hypothetical protein